MIGKLVPSDRATDVGIDLLPAGAKLSDRTAPSSAGTHQPPARMSLVTPAGLDFRARAPSRPDDKDLGGRGIRRAEFGMGRRAVEISPGGGYVVWIEIARLFWGGLSCRCAEPRVSR